MAGYSVTIDTRTALRAYEAVLKQFPFATSQALNAVATDFRGAEREHLADEFTIRRPWVQTGVQIPRGGFARKDRLAVEVKVEAKRDFLWKFETQVQYEPRSGRFAVPVEVPVTGKGIIRKGFRPKDLELQQYLLSGDTRYLGKKRTFVIEDAGGVGGIFQRTGRRKRSDIRLLYWFRKSTPIDPDLDFEQNARKVFEEQFIDHYNRFLIAALETAKIR